MNKEEVLEKSRQENKYKDIVELEASDKAGSNATSVGMLMCCFLSVIQIIFKEEVDLSCWIIFFSMLGVKMLIKYIRLKDKTFLLIAGIYIVVFVFFFIIHLLKLVGVI